MAAPDVAAAVEQMADVVRRLPQCDRAAKLRVLVSRVRTAVIEGGDLEGARSALADASARALEDDPWAQLDCLVQHLKQRDLPEPSRTHAGTHARSHGPDHQTKGA